MKKLFPLFFALFAAYSVAGQSISPNVPPQLGKDPVKSIIAAMTLEEKAKLVTGMGFGASFTHEPIAGRTEVKVAGAAGATYGVPRLNIPTIIMADGPAGVRIDPVRGKDSSRTYYATAFPVATLLASSWDTALVREVGRSFGNEVHEYGIDIILAPALNIHRNPLGGRNFEYYSEDPLLSGEMAAAMVNGIQSNGVGTSVKHFAANNQETNRNNINAVISERALREIYLKGFEIAIKKSDPWTVMSSYNKINGTYTSESYDLLTTILRNEWRFKGFVMTDWFGGKDPVAQMNAGNDLLMPGTVDQVKKIMEAVNNGQLKMEVLNKNVADILNILIKTPTFKHYAYSDSPDLKAHAIISRTSAAEGMILLKNNNNALPLKPTTTLALFGSNSYGLIAGGTGSGAVNKRYVISIVHGLKNAGFSINPELEKIYSEFVAAYRANHPMSKNVLAQIKPIAELDIAEQEVEKMADANDAAVITIGRNAGEARDRKLDEDFYLSKAEKQLIDKVSQAFHKRNKKVVVVLNIDNVIETAGWINACDGLLLAWQPGQEGGNAIADIISGKVNPSGKLATTFPVDYDDIQSSKNFPGIPVEKPLEVAYKEGIYVGYRYFNTFHVKQAFEFGYGLSYTTFKYGEVKLSSHKLIKAVTARISVTNTGKIPGKEVVELYINAPAGTLDKPQMELKGFAKTRLLQPGESQWITFTVKARDLASFHVNKESWITDAGKYELKIGASSNDIKTVGLFSIAKALTVEKVHKAVAPLTQVSDLKAKK
ncbi:beta-glucosidase [Mucilaginibacter sp. SP1R1]|uniref:beta-glucosidase n=1 Tax=Mucilaginibacter sp. SP1R1 TaxID=2723091 RepID=UPI00161D0757|nr:glycoside hydrolase family 3 C-terminal domain-containing protein [Mucilaginibacter sp. SP1R1]MBB6149998.1 beta-glucosidase [Mucilaginibacter sp. SP1R1]